MGAVGYVLLAVAIVLIIVTMVLLIMLLRKKGDTQQVDNSSIVIAEVNKVNNVLGRDVERVGGTINGQVAALSNSVNALTDKYDKFMQSVAQQFEQIRKDNNAALLQMKQDNAQEMEKMRQVVDQKLSENLEQKFNASFKLVSDRMVELTKEFEELQNLQSSVKDLNSIFKNVKTRGTWGEVSLENLLSQILTPDQFEKQVNVEKTKTGFSKTVLNQPNISELEQYAIEIASKAILQIKEGNILPSPTSESCLFCEFRSLCLYNDDQGYRSQKSQSSYFNKKETKE